ncbi:OmpL47-type beta-barrel domain-containing protein [Paenibacillus beijingensis]|uniref:Carbohydrate-binding domain-containing protein n=1 Tax=Paenibacillus beijingensis TaxID=1126833 RepID=A0A0D5NH42_9BACL|nr:hypothetical protein [Paenibacillus beijingensis]AJY74277.1 hypothetical protein VN24_06385 [Paenibacillus beijingensis]
MSWHKKALSVLVSAAIGFGSFLFPAAYGVPEPRANAASSLTTEVSLGDFESTDEIWDFLIGGSGNLGNGEYSLDPAIYQFGNSSGKMQLDFSKYFAVSLERYTFKRILPVDAAEISFWVKTGDFKALDLVLMDSSNQNHQQTINLQPVSDWQKITVSSFTSGTNYIHFGGKNDGIWYGPLKKIYFKLSKPGLITGKTAGTIWLDDIRAKVNTPDLAIVQTQVGNVFAGSRTATMDVLTTGDQVAWTAYDAYGGQVATGSMPVEAGKARLNVQVPADGYYRLKVDAYQAGALVKTAETTFAALPAFDISQVADSPFAIQAHFGIGWNREMMPVVEYSGVKSVRDSFFWSEIELTQGQYSFNPKFTLPMQSMKERGIDPFLVFAFTNQYYDNFQTPYTDSAREGYANYVKAVVNKFGSQLQSGEIWNEFNLPFFGGKGPAASRADMYFELLKKGYEAVKSVRPDLNVVGAATAGIPHEWLTDVFELGGLNYMDTLSVHPYRYPDSPEGLIGEIDRLNELVRTHNNGATIPIWFSEIGWPTHLNPLGVDENTQAAYLIRSYVVSIASGVEKIFWYDLMNDGTDKLNNEHNFGIIHNSGDELGAYTPKPAYVALATMTRQLTGATVAAQMTSDGIYHYSFNKDNNAVHVLWSLDKKDVALSTQTPLVITDMMGRSDTYVPNQGKVYLTLSGEPLFVQGSIDTIDASSRFKLAGGLTYTEDPVTLTFTEQDASPQETVTVSFQGISKDLTVTAAGSYPLQFPGVVEAGKKTAFATVQNEAGKFARLSETFDVITPQEVTAKHILKNESEDVLEVIVDNKRPFERRLMSIDWNIGGITGATNVDMVIPAYTKRSVEIPVPDGLPYNTLLPYTFNLTMADGKTLQYGGNLKLVDAGSMFPLDYRTAEQMNSLPDSGSIDLVTDVNLKIATYGGAEDLSGKLWFGYDSEYLYLSANVHDDAFSQPFEKESIWQGDGVQFAVSAGTPGENGQWYEYGAALTPTGPELYRWLAPQGIVPGTVTNRTLQITRDETAKDTIYRLAVPWSELTPIVPEDGILSLSVVVNDNDGNGRKGYIEWGSGIGSSKQSSLFKPVIIHADVTAPTTTSSVSPAAPDGQNGWYVHGVTVSLDAADDRSGVAESVYSLDGGTAWQVYTGAVPFDQDGTYSFSYRSTDLAGNVEAAHTIGFNMDATAPVIDVTAPAESSYSDAGDLTPQYTVTDPLSGVDAQKTTATLDGGIVAPGTTIPLYSLPLGSHTFTVNASDLAGNTQQKTVTFQTYTNIDSLKKLVSLFEAKKWISKAEIAASLQKKLQKGDIKGFIAQVKEQTGKSITNEAASYLLRDANAILQSTNTAGQSSTETSMNAGDTPDQPSTETSVEPENTAAD